MSRFLLQLQNYLYVLFPCTAPGKLSPLYSKINWKQLEAALNYTIKKKDFFVQALLHRSYLQFIEDMHCQSNERYEFVGDAVLNLVVAEFLHNSYLKAEEGELTVLRSKLVNRKALVYYAREIDLLRFLLMNPNPSFAGEKGIETIIADAYEAMIAAIYQDGGLNAARIFIERQLTSALNKGYLQSSDNNFKSELLELSQAQGKGVPRYSIIREEGPDHDRTFTIEVFVENHALGAGVGKNKKEAEQAAAEQALQKLKGISKNLQGLF